jgi:hypothetical protein
MLIYTYKFYMSHIEPPFKSLILRVIMINYIVIEKYNYNESIQENKLIVLVSTYDLIQFKFQTNKLIIY